MRSAECGISGRGRSPSDAHIETPHSAFRIPHWGEGEVLSIDLRGKRALVAGVADDAGYGFAIAKALAEAGAAGCAGTLPPAPNIFLNLLARGKIRETRRVPGGAGRPVQKIHSPVCALATPGGAPWAA